MQSEQPGEQIKHEANNKHKLFKQTPFKFYVPASGSNSQQVKHNGVFTHGRKTMVGVFTHELNHNALVKPHRVVYERFVFAVYYQTHCCLDCSHTCLQ